MVFTEARNNLLFIKNLNKEKRMIQLLIERFFAWLRGYKHDKELKRLHPAFRKTNDGCWYYNYASTVKNITYEVRVIFDNHLHLNNCPCAAKISHNDDQGVIGEYRGFGKYIAFLHGTEEEKKAILSFASKFPYAELIDTVQESNGSMTASKKVRTRIPEFQNDQQKSEWINQHTKNENTSVINPVTTSIKNEQAMTAWVKSFDYFFIVVDPQGHIFGQKEDLYLYVWTSEEKLNDFMFIYNQISSTPSRGYVILKETRVNIFTKARRLGFSQVVFNPSYGNTPETIPGINAKDEKYYFKESNLPLTAYTEEELRILYS